ncbi:MAG: hypothetical protein JW720_14650 [Sedimentisphaerales bacterium]|nr:hypothetical protein [Sedimentisphaerales bacterium]
MRRLRFLIVALGVLAACTTTTVFAEGDVGIEITTDFFSKYIWRGQNLDDDPVFQPGLSITHKNFTASVWGNFEFTNINGNRGDFSELDYSIDYSAPFPGIKGVGYSIGLIYYDFPGTAVKDTTEAYWGFNLDAPLSPSLTFYHDLDEAEGTYIALACSHSVERIAEIAPGIPVAMDIGVSLGWGSGSYNKYYWGTDQTKLNDLAISASFPFEVAGLTIVPSLNYVTLLSDDIRATDAYGTGSDFFYAGIGFVKEF